ncbi:MAG: hypothetical protein K2L28_10335 [Muribaculaceae bacterium]|nr:hypothetical protein [Muribaculaceae bacterium]
MLTRFRDGAPSGACRGCMGWVRCPTASQWVVEKPPLRGSDSDIRTYPPAKRRTDIHRTETHSLS